MNLTNEQILPFVHNALRAETDPQGRLRFLRFTPEQTADYGLDSEGYPIRCRASANVTLDFITDSDWFAVEYDVQIASSQPFYSMDLFVDGVMTDSLIREGFASGRSTFRIIWNLFAPIACAASITPASTSLTEDSTILAT